MVPADRETPPVSRLPPGEHLDPHAVRRVHTLPHRDYGGSLPVHSHASLVPGWDEQDPRGGHDRHGLGAGVWYRPSASYGMEQQEDGHRRLCVHRGCRPQVPGVPALCHSSCTATPLVRNVSQNILRDQEKSK